MRSGHGRSGGGPRILKLGGQGGTGRHSRDTTQLGHLTMYTLWLVGVHDMLGGVHGRHVQGRVHPGQGTGEGGSVLREAQIRSASGT